MADELMKGMSQISIDDYNENIGIHSSVMPSSFGYFTLFLIYFDIPLPNLIFDYLNLSLSLLLLQKMSPTLISPVRLW
jgi:hypothetical protein